MPKHDIVSEDDVPAATAEHQRVQTFAQREPERSGHTLRQHDDELMFNQRLPPCLSHDEGRIFLARRYAAARELILYTGNPVHSHPRSLYHANVFRMPS